MEWVRRRAGSLLGVGLVAGLGWSVAVTLAMPGWFDSSGDCAKAALRADGSVVRTEWFPPRATCHFRDGYVYEFISPTQSAVLSVVGIVIAVVLATGLVLTVRRLWGEPGPHQPAGADVRRRRFNQLTFGAVDMGVGMVVITVSSLLAIVFGGLIGSLIFAGAAIIALCALGALLDRHMGPLPSTPLDSRRRGTVAGLIVFGVTLAATAAAGQLPFFQLWSAPVAAVTYAVVAAVQWSRLPHPRQDHQPTTPERLAG